MSNIFKLATQQAASKSIDSEKIINPQLTGDPAKSAGIAGPLATQSPYKHPMTNFFRTDVDFDLLGAIEPLLLQQKSYIQNLERELNFTTSKFQDVEKRMEALRREYERELDQVQKNYQSHMSKYREEERQLIIQHKIVESEREDLERLSSLYRTSNENLETINHRLMSQVQVQDEMIVEKDKEIKMLREEVILQSRKTYDIQQQVESMNVEFQNKIQMYQRVHENFSIAQQQLASAEHNIQNLTMDNKILTSKLQGLNSLSEETIRNSRAEVQTLQDDLDRYKSLYHQTKSQLTKQTADYDSLREHRMQLQRELKEAKHDCDVMSKLLEEQEQKAQQLQDRDKLLLEQEQRLKERQSEVSIQEDRLRVLLDINQRMKTELEEKTAADSRQVEIKVAKALDNERKRMKEDSDSKEAEIKELHRLIGEYKRESEWSKGELSGFKDELKQAKITIERLSQEKVILMEENQIILDKIRTENDIEMRDLSQKVQDLTQNQMHLEHQNTLISLSQNHFEQRSRDLQTQIQLIEDELTRTKLQRDSAQRDKDLLESKLTRELNDWRQRAEELSEYSEEQVSKYGLREERRRADGREERLKAWDALVQQERIAQRWKYELEQAVTTYEASIKKLKRENKNLKKIVIELKAKLEYPNLAYIQDSAESTLSQSPEQSSQIVPEKDVEQQ